MSKPKEYLIITPDLQIITVIPVAYNEHGYLALGVDKDGNTYGNRDIISLVGCNNTIRASISLNEPPTKEEIESIIRFAVMHTEAIRAL